MGLEFTHMSDQRGAGIYILYDGSVTQERAVTVLAKEINDKQKGQQITLLSVRDHNAQQILQFYGLSASACPHILVIADDDRVLHAWSGPQLPSIDHVSYAISSSH